MGKRIAQTKLDRDEVNQVSEEEEVKPDPLGDKKDLDND